MKTGLFFGSFNPVHVGHLIIANFMATQTDLKEVWFVVSPQNPFKKKKSLAKDYDRLHLVRLAIDQNARLKVTDIEFSMPKPSYTIDTLTYLREKYPKRSFVLIMGGDNVHTFDRWKNYEQILAGYEVYVYKRPDTTIEAFAGHPKFSFFEAPQMNISATYIRKCIANKKSIRYLVTEPVHAYIENSNLYR